MPYPTGLKVRIKSKQEVLRLDSYLQQDDNGMLIFINNQIVENMFLYFNKMATIQNVIEYNFYESPKFRYFLDIDEQSFTWEEDWIEPLTKAGDILYGKK
jgi:hypothetical protein